MDLKAGHGDIERASTYRKGSLRVETGQRGWDRMSQTQVATGWHWSVRANQELDAGSHGSKRVKTVYYEVPKAGINTAALTDSFYYTAYYRRGHNDFINN